MQHQPCQNLRYLSCQLSTSLPDYYELVTGFSPNPQSTARQCHSRLGVTRVRVGVVSQFTQNSRNDLHASLHTPKHRYIREMTLQYPQWLLVRTFRRNSGSSKIKIPASRSGQVTLSSAIQPNLTCLHSTQLWTAPPASMTEKVFSPLHNSVTQTSTSPSSPNRELQMSFLSWVPLCILPPPPPPLSTLPSRLNPHI